MRRSTDGPIWKEEVNIDEVNNHGAGTMVSHLDIRFTEVGDDYIIAQMPVDERTKQPYGLLHGGASVALAETVASTAANYCVDRKRQVCVGLEINANHLRSKRSGTVIATGRPIHIGRKTHVWEIEMTDETGVPVAVSRLTLAVIDRR